MEVIKKANNVEFNVIYDDGTRRRVKEGILHEVENEEIIFHNGTNRVEVWCAAAEDMLKILNDVPNGIESLMAGMAVDDSAVKTVTKMRRMLKAVCELEKEESVEKKAVFRLGQMDMRESIAAMLKDLADGTHGMVCSTLVDAAERVMQMEIP